MELDDDSENHSLFKFVRINLSQPFSTYKVIILFLVFFLFPNFNVTYRLDGQQPPYVHAGQRTLARVRARGKQRQPTSPRDIQITSLDTCQDRSRPDPRPTYIGRPRLLHACVYTSGDESESENETQAMLHLLGFLPSYCIHVASLMIAKRFRAPEFANEPCPMDHPIKMGCHWTIIYALPFFLLHQFLGQRIDTFLAACSSKVTRSNCDCRQILE